MDAKTEEHARLAKALRARLEAIHGATDHPPEKRRGWVIEAVHEFTNAMNQAEM